MKESREKKLSTLKKLVDNLFQQERQVRIMNDSDVRKVFKLDKEKQKKKGVVSLETWTELAEKVLVVAERKLEQQQQNGLDKWLNRQLTYQEALVHHVQKKAISNNNKTKKINKHPESYLVIGFLPGGGRRRFCGESGNCLMWNLAGVINRVLVFLGIG